MKKNLLFAGLLLAAVPALAQEQPTRHPESDPYQIFKMDFEFKDETGLLNEEELFRVWQLQEIDRIDSVQYYIHKKESGDNLGNQTKPWTERDKWQRGPWRDTTIILRNDVMVADNPDDSAVLINDSWRLISENRSEELGDFGITGGERFFQYIAAPIDTAVKLSNQSAYYKDTHRVARYRRNLFVRGIAGQGNIPIQDTTSYRFTAYVTANYNGNDESMTPILYADVMRGHFASEKSFSMGIENNAKEYKYNGQFTKDVEFMPADRKNAQYKLGEWNKVTFMTYYINDSIADDYVFVDGYWWDANWSWTSEETGGEEWNYIVQPDKFFVRISFAQDSTTYGIDDISLTKSWIGGCEYNGDKLRVDFGYETNLKDLCEASLEKNNISSVEIVGDYFDVWGRYEGEWERVPIRSAEYQKDGYMYMFTDRSENFDGDYADFDVYDSVLVSFKNPKDPEKRLCYSGSLFPRAWDVEWIKSGRPVMDFTNEFATPNPVVGNGIWSMLDLPPVLKGGYTYEAGSFQLDGAIRRMDFVFSRRICYDDAGLASKYALLKVKNGSTTETWFVDNINVINSDSAIVTFCRPDTYQGNLAGDYEFEFIQLKGAADPDESEGSTTNEVTDWATGAAIISYSFGPQPATEGLVAKASFESIKKADKEANQNAPTGFSLEKCYVKVANYSGLFTKGLMWGVLNKNTGHGEHPSKDNCPKLSYGFNIDSVGDYDFQVVYARVSGDNRKMGVQILDEAGNEIWYEEAQPANDHKQKDDAELKAGSLDTVTINLADVAVGSYKMVLSMPDTPDGNYGWGMRFGNINDSFVLFSLTITEKGRGFDYSLSIGYPYTSAFAAAKANLSKSIAKAETDADQYKGAAYDDANGVKSKYANFNDAKDVTAPSAWSAATNELIAAKKGVDDHIALDDEMWKQYGLLSDTLAYFEGLELTEMGSYKAGVAALATYKNVKGSEITDDSIKAIIKICQDAMTEMDNQYKSIEPYRAVLKTAQDSVAGKYLVETDEYSALSNAVSVAEDFNEATAASTDIVAMQNDLLKALFPYIDVVNRDKVSKLNMAALDSLASKLYTFDGDKKQIIADCLADRQYNKLESFFKKAIKSAIYDKFVKGEDVDSLPVNALIKNNELYASVKIVDRSTKKMPDNAGDLSKADENGGNIQYVQHSYNAGNLYGKQPIWVMILTQSHTDLLPDWTVTAKNEGSNKMVTVDDSNYANVSTKSFFNGDLGMDWTSRATLTQELDELPVGMYSIGANFVEHCGNNTDITANGRKATIASSAKGNQGVDSVMVAEDGMMNISLNLSSESGWSRVDDFFMTFHADSTKNYEALAAAVLEELNEYATFDDAADEAEAQYEYYTLDGIKTDAPEGIVLRKNIATGEVEKVLFK